MSRPSSPGASQRQVGGAAGAAPRSLLSRWTFDAISDEARDRINRLVEYGKGTIQYGWIPLILLLGYLRSDPRPSLLRMINPLS